MCVGKEFPPGAGCKTKMCHSTGETTHCNTRKVLSAACLVEVLPTKLDGWIQQQTPYILTILTKHSKYASELD